MSWHYQVMRHTLGADTYYAVHEFYEDPKGWTTNPVTLEAQSISELLQMCERIISDIRKNGLINYETGEEIRVPR